MDIQKITPTNRTDTYTYRLIEIVMHGLVPLGSNSTIDIIFKNGEFKECQLPFNGDDLAREQWRALGVINALISKLENRYASEPSFPFGTKPGSS